MELSKLGYQIIDGNGNPTKHIERIARVCYKSEDRIADGTDKVMVKNLCKRSHYAMLEHFRFIMQIPLDIYQIIEVVDHDFINMTHSEFNGTDRYVISGSARAIRELPIKSNAEHHGVLPMVINTISNCLMLHIANKYCSPELFGESFVDEYVDLEPTFDVTFIDNERESMSAREFDMHGWMSVLFRVDRGVSHEIVRHRLSSFAQESTRYCNYGGTGVCVIDSEFENRYPEDKKDDIKCEWLAAMCDAEKHYNRLIELGVAPQDARSVLSHSTKVDIVVTTYANEWRHIFNLRALGATGKPHPMMQEVMTPLMNECKWAFN